MKADSPTQMDADFDDMEEPKLMKRPLKNSLITVIIKPIVDKRFKVDVSSDAKRVEIRWDWGRNKRNINTFKKLMLSNQSKRRFKVKE
jgi:hypothetical protein